MKKTALLAVALATCLGYAPAQAADVVSSNIVGYNKITLQPGLNMIGGLFQKIGTGVALSLQDQFADAANNANYGTASDSADTITTWDASVKGYTKIYYFYADPDNPDPDYDYTWDDADTEDIADVSVSDATGGWYKNVGTTPITLTMAGEVPTNTTYTVTLVNGLNFVANPYPAPIALNGTNFSVDGVVYGTASDSADTITTWDASVKGYTKIYYYYADPDNPDPNYDYTWDDADTEDITNFEIAPGQGFWYKHIGTGATMTFHKPY